MLKIDHLSLNGDPMRYANGMSAAATLPVTQRIRVLAVADHTMLHDGIAAAVRAQTDMDLVGEASDEHEALEQFRALRPDVTLLDMNMSAVNGVDTIQCMRAESPQARIIVLTTSRGDMHAVRALKAGAISCLLKTARCQELLGAIRAANRGRSHVPSEIALSIVAHLGVKELGPREIEVIRRVATGFSNKEIGAHLSITEGTVKTYMKSIRAKLGANNRSHALAIALERGFIDL